MDRKMSQKEVSRFMKLAGILKEDRKLTFVRPFPGGDPGDPGHGEDYPAATVYEKGNNVVFKYGDPGFDGVPSIVYVMRNKNIYNAIDVLDKAGFPVEGDRIELDPEDEYAIDDLLDSLEAKGVVTMFNPETDIYTKKDVDKYNSYLPDDEQYEYEDLGIEESLNEWDPDKEWDEEDDEEESGEEYPSDEELFGISENAEGNRTLEQKEKIGEKLQYAVEDYLEDLGLREISDEERPKFQKGLGYTKTSPSDVFINKLNTGFHFMTPEDDPKRKDPRHNDQEVNYSLRIYNPNEKFNINTLRSFIKQAKQEAKSQGFQFFDKLNRSNKDILFGVTIR